MDPTIAATQIADPPPRLRLPIGVLAMSGLAVAVVAFLIIGLALPLITVVAQSTVDAKGKFVGLANYLAYLSTSGALTSLRHTMVVGILSTLITIPLAFAYAYAIHRSCMPGKGLFRSIAMVPLLTPSLLFALSLVLLFGNQGMLKDLLLGESIYGLSGIAICMAFAHFPHTFIVISAALSLADRRHFEAAESLGASRLRIFWTVTLPGAKYGLISASIISFIMSITDFGIPKIIGGQYNVLATDIYKQVIGQQNFELGAVISVLLLVCAAASFVVARVVQRKQTAMMSGRAVPYEPTPRKGFDTVMLVFCSAVALVIIGVLVVAVYSSFIRFWPYNVSLTLKHYNFENAAGGGWQSYWNSLSLATWTALVGTVIVFIGAYLVEKTREVALLRRLIQALAVLPMAVPGLVLGLAYIFFFNKPGNPLGAIYGSMTILVLVTVIHYYSVTHLTLLTALKQVDPEVESISDSLKASRFRTLGRVTLPLCMPAVLDVSIYFFLSAMSTVSAVVFLYSSETNLASIAVINMDDAGEFAYAIAMACVISGTCIAARGLHLLLTRGLRRRANAWRAVDV
jgi:iron(III) transport system permease protein